MVIASALPALRFEPGLPLPRLESSGEPGFGEASSLGSAYQPNEIFKLILIGAIALVAIAVAIRIFIRVDWSAARRVAAGTAIVVLGIAGAIYVLFTLFPHAPALDQATGMLPKQGGKAGARLGPVPPMLFWLVGALLVALAALGGCKLAASRARPAGELLGHEAEAALRALLAGESLGDVVTACYRNMGAALERDRGALRERGMTTREFEERLVLAGAPAACVRELTRLFEAVRYGSHDPDRAEEERAIRCLEGIVRACGPESAGGRP
jgi:hypothetical protein